MDVLSLSIFGLTEKDMEETNIVYLYPDNWDTFMAFEFLSTQWRTSGNGAIGLDYNVIPLALSTLEVSEEDAPETVLGIRVMEATALKTMNENQRSD